MRSNTIRGSIAMLLLATGASLAQIARVDPVVLGGAAAPGCGVASVFTNFDRPYLNDSGALAFWGATNDSYWGIWTWTGSSLQAVATGTTSNTDFTQTPAINAGGSIAYRALTSSTTSGVFRWDAGTTTTIASSSQAIPDETGTPLSGSPAFGSLASYLGDRRAAVLLSDQGHVVFQHSLTTASEYFQGWWWSDGSTLKALAYLRQSYPVPVPISWYPTSPWGSEAVADTHNADLNSSGQASVLVLFDRSGDETALFRGRPQV